MVQPLPPPRNYRAKTRLARCREREEAQLQRRTSQKSGNTQCKDLKQPEESSNTWVQFDSSVSSSWSCEYNDDHCAELQSIEVDLRETLGSSFNVSSQNDWKSQPIDKNVSDLPVIPLPPPYSLTRTRNSRGTSLPPTPLQQRDTNTNTRRVSTTLVSNREATDKKSASENNSNIGSRNLVTNPIESTRGRSSSTSNENLRNRSRSRSIFRNSRDDKRKRDSSVTGHNNRKETDSPLRVRGGPSRPRERSSSITQPSNENDSKAESKGKISDSVNVPRRSRSTTRGRSSSLVPLQRGIIKSSTRSYSVASSRSDATCQISKIMNHEIELSSPRRELRSSSSFDEGRVANTASSRVLTANNHDGESNARNTLAITSSFAVLPRPIHTRTLLTSSVYNNAITGIWITTINMNQNSNVTKSNAAKYLKAFSFHTEREARESAYANAPPTMLPFSENPRCFVCDVRFNVLRRASHCRNCGVCICNGCSVSRNKQSLPETYNVKNDGSVKVCTSCDSLSRLFQKALIDGDFETALVIYNTGNINLRCQFMSAKGTEAMLPIHCATEGGNLKLLQWLVDVHYCPINRIRTGNKYKNQSTNELITTSKGRNVLQIAMAGKNVDILNYLVNEKNISLESIKSLDIALGALEAVLLAFPTRHELVDDEDNSLPSSPLPSFDSNPLNSLEKLHRTPIKNGIPLYEINDHESDDESTDTSSNQSSENDYGSDGDESVATTVHDACIICYENSIDCVITPCGHQICCLQCSKNMTSCPVCNDVNCKFIKIFRP